jgi:BirA family transcriptional regulator, biotin operon repressor / biotin---[acetyl-CoA-carboxylase] ligase
VSEEPAPVLGRPRLHLRSTGSTNDRARELALAGAPHGTLVTASEQTAGRGRHGRRWSAPPGRALLLSLVVRCAPGARPRLLPLAAAVAVCDVAGADARVKWPNDVVLARGRALAKLAGILIEGRPQDGWAVLGIGLNVAVELSELPEELHDSAATMGLSRAQIEPVLSALLAALAQRIAEPAQDTLAAWRERDALRGRDVAWADGEGRAEGVDGDGRLIVARADGGRQALAAGEVHLLAPR